MPQKWQFLACLTHYYYLPENSPLYFEHLAAFDKTFPSDSMRAFTQLIRGELCTNQARFDSARACLNESFELNTKLGHLEDAGDAKRFLARTYLHEGDFSESIRLLLEALELYERKDTAYDSNRYFNIRLDLANAYMASQDHREALKWGQKAWDYAQTPFGTRGFKIIAAANLAQNYIYLNRPDSALAMANRTLEFHYYYNHFYELDKTHFILAQAYQAGGDCKTALSHFQQATCCISPDANRVKFFKYDEATADCYLCLGRLDSAEFFYQKCLASPDTVALADVHAGLSKIYSKRADFKRALFHADESRRLHEATFNAEKTKIVGNLNVKFATAEQERRISEIKNQQKITRQQTLIVFLVLTLSLAAALFFSIQQRHRRRLLQKGNLLLEQEKQLTVAREALQKQELDRSQANLEAKSRELEQSAQLLLLKNQLIEELKMQVSENPESRRDAALAGEIPEKKSFQQLKILTDMDWQTFRARFEERFPGFLGRLKAHFSQFTAAETRLFLLVKLGFETREIAGVLGISTESIWKARYRLRKKLGLLGNDDFDALVRAFV